MRCPYCKSALEANQAACMRCGLTLEKVTKLFGVVPPIVEGISDNANMFSAAQKRRIQARATELAIRFPQITVSVVTANLPANTGVSVYAFWIFNEAAVARKVDRGSNNFDVLLTLDPRNGRSSLTVGYGLESYVSESDLQSVMADTRESFERENYCAGVESAITSLTDRLTQIAANLKQTHGIAPIVSAKSTPLEVSPTEF